MLTCVALASQATSSELSREPMIQARSGERHRRCE
eukprot:CAMPEP_0195578162 /NCGR_PEP_ID=MMETSP0814-20130614/11627_1 /TAXON_ID=97485 /ORGANISM="Prymnesium parvum, Strain Texoma1" /LENGTH=34 /DNA_ID= /DNA_START= /DNA_END= /DNA_ORIENTATION=